MSFYPLIMIVGNLATGKTTLRAEITNYYSPFLSIDIDTLRKTSSSEKETWEIMDQEVFRGLKNGLVILETCGVGLQHEALYKKYASSGVLLLTLVTDMKEIRDRIQNRSREEVAQDELKIADYLQESYPGEKISGSNNVNIIFDTSKMNLEALVTSSRAHIEDFLRWLDKKPSGKENGLPRAI